MAIDRKGGEPRGLVIDLRDGRIVRTYGGSVLALSRSGQVAQIDGDARIRWSL